MNKMIDENDLLGSAPKFPFLSGFDYCDRCGASESGVEIAQACVRVYNKHGLDMVFCMHHFNELEPRLLGAGWYIYEDKRASLQTKPGASA